MKFKLSMECNTFENGKTIIIVTKTNFIDILKQLSNEMNLTKFKKIKFSQINVVSRDIKIRSNKRKLTFDERNSMKKLGLSVLSEPNGSDTSPIIKSVALATRSINIGEVSYESRIGGLQGGKGENLKNSSHVLSTKQKISTRIFNEKSKDVSKWVSKDFWLYMKKKYYEQYGTDSFELVADSVAFSSGYYSGYDAMNRAMGRTLSIIKYGLIEEFKKAGYDSDGLKDYIDWIYDDKAGRLSFPVTLAFIKSKALITEWITRKATNKLKRKESVREMKFRKMGVIK